MWNNDFEGFQYEKNNKKSETKAARNYGEKTAKEASYTNPPIDIFSLAEGKYGLKIRKISLNDNISAIVELDTNEINLNKDKPFNHLRFTLAHELGHILLNHKQRKWTEYSVYLLENNQNKPLEEEANAFAAGLLMPKYLLTKYASKKNSPSQLAKIFQVSEEAMWYSIKYYKLLNKFL